MMKTGRRMMAVLAGLGVLLTCCMPVYAEQKPDAGATMQMTGVSVGREEIRSGREIRMSPMRLMFGARLIFPRYLRPRGDGAMVEKRYQSLSLTDSTGKKLAPAVFDMYRLIMPQKENDSLVVNIMGRGAELASPEAAWVRLKGEFRMVVELLGESPLYELPLRQGASVDVVLPLQAEENSEGDVALVGNELSGKLFLAKLEMSDDLKNGGKRLQVRLVLEVDSKGYDGHFRGMLIVNGEDEISLVEGDSIIASEGVWMQSISLRPAEKLKSLKIKASCRVNTKEEVIPVDVKVGLRGPIPDRKK